MMSRTTSVASVGSVWNMKKPKCNHCCINHFGECKLKYGSCFRCETFDHFLKDFFNWPDQNGDQNVKPIVAASRGRRTKNSGNIVANRGGRKDTTLRYEARAPAKVYSICAREGASAPDVITNIFSLFDAIVYALIDLRSTHSYICTTLVT